MTENNEPEMGKCEQIYEKYFERREQKNLFCLTKGHDIYLLFILKGTTGSSAGENTRSPSSEVTPSEEGKLGE